MSALLARLIRDSSAASTAEFVMVLPVLLLFVFGAVDVGGYAWKLNRLEKATQMGARFAVVTAPVAQGLASETYLGRLINPANANSGTLVQGQIIPASALGLVTCTGSASCTCTTAPCLSDMTASTTAFNALVARMASFDPTIGATGGASVVVEYRGSGLGFAGDPDGMEIAPLVTVRLSGAQYRPILGMLLRGTISLPDFSYTLPMEDGTGTASN